MEPGNRILTRTLSLTIRNTGTRRGFRLLTVFSLVCILLPPAFASTVKQKKQAAKAQFEVAEGLRESLNGKPESQRTRHDYDRVLDAYRMVYHTAPNFNKADTAVLAVAELLDEQGRVLNDPKSFKDAIGQLEFLRREYPGSKYRGEALFTIAQIYRDDLDDSVQAKTTFQDFLKHYPTSKMADRAQQEIDDIDAQARKEQTGKNKSSADARTKSGSSEKDSAPEAKNDRHHLPLLTNIRHWSTGDYTRVAIDLEQEVKYEAGRVPHPDRIFFDLHGAKLAPGLAGKSFQVDDGFLHRIRIAQYKANLARVVLDVDDVAEYSAFLLPNPYRLIIDIHGRKTAVKVAAKHPAASTKTDVQPGTAKVVKQPDASASVTATPASKTSDDTMPADKTVEVAKTDEPKPIESKIDEAKIDEKDKATSKPTTSPAFQAVAPHERDKTASKTKSKSNSSDVTVHAASPSSSGQRSLIRALGLKIGKIVIDAGHGGHDTGTIGPNGLMEKDLVLDVALKLGKLLEDRMGAEVIYTRDDDTFIPLETRTAIANKEQADLFISIHANSSGDASARGIETYYLNFTSSADALEVAARENAVSEKSIHELQDLVKKIALKEKIEESREFAADVQRSLYAGLSAKSSGIRNRGVTKAPFVVLIGANMPSILAEISFVSNPTDAKKLDTSEYRQRIAESLYKGIAKYVSGLSGVRVAARLTKSDGQ